MSNKNLMNKLQWRRQVSGAAVVVTNYITLFIDGLFISTAAAPNWLQKSLAATWTVL